MELKTTAAQIKVTAVTSRGSYHPTGGSGIDLAGDSAAAIPLPSLSGVPAALQISSNVPVAAATTRRGPKEPMCSQSVAEPGPPL